MSILFGYKYISPVGPRWGQVSAEFPIKKSSYSDQLLLKKTHNLTHFDTFYYAQDTVKLYSPGPSAQARPAYSPGRFAPRLERLPRAFGARAARSPHYLGATHQAIQKIRTVICPADLPQHPIPPRSRLGPCPPLHGRLLRIHSAPSRNNRYKIRKLPVHKNSFF